MARRRRPRRGRRGRRPAVRRRSGGLRVELARRRRRRSGQRGWKRQPAGGRSALGISPRTSSAAGAAGRVGERDRVDQRPGVRVPRRAEHELRRAGLDDPAEVHDRRAIREVLDDGQVVGDEHDRQAELALQRGDQVQDLGLDEDVERRDRLVGHEHVRARARARRRSPTRWRCPPESSRGRDVAWRSDRPTASSSSRTRARALGGDADLRRRRAARARCRATVQRGSSEPNGSWKTGCSRRRSSRSRRPPACPGRSRRTRSGPPSAGSSPSRQRPSVVLPRARLADQGQDLAAPQLEVDAVHRVHRRRARAQPAADAEVLDHALGREQRRGGDGAHHSLPAPLGWAASVSPPARRVSSSSQQATACSPPASGGMRSHSSSRSGQRGAKRQPGRRPGQVGHAARRRRGSAPRAAGRRAARRAASGCRDGAARRTAGPPARARRAGRRTAPPTRSQTWATTPRSWVISMIVVPVALAQRPQQRRGSGPGWSRRARSSARRRSAAPGRWPAPWRWPRAAACRPRSGAAGRRSGARRRGSRPRAAARWPAARASRRLTGAVGPDGLGDLGADRRTPGRGPRPRPGRSSRSGRRAAGGTASPRSDVRSCSPNAIAPSTVAGRGSRPIAASASVVLPQPDSPTSPRISPSATRSETSASAETRRGRRRSDTPGRGTRARRVTRLHPAGIEAGAQAVAEEGEGQHGEGDREPGKTSAHQACCSTW